jgi:hypothetical protein
MVRGCLKAKNTTSRGGLFGGVMVLRVFVELLARVFVLVAVMPLLVRVIDGVLGLLPVISRWGFRFDVLTYDVAVSIVFLVLYLFSLVLLASSVILVDPLFYTLSLLPLVVTGGFDVSWSAYIVLVVVLLSFLSVVIQGYREGQFSSFRVRGFPALLVSLSSLAVIVVSLSYAISLLSWSYIEALRGVSVGSSVLEPLVSFLSGNPLGNMLVVALVLSALYHVAVNLSETLTLYLRPSRDVALKALTLDPYAPIKPPLTSLRNAIVTLAVSPAVYALLAQSLTRLGLLPGSEEGFQPVVTLARWALSLLTLILTWALLTRALTRFDEREPGLGGIVAGLTLIALTYGLLLIAGLWDPGSEGLSLDRADSYLASTIAGYYRVLFSILELVPMLIGLAP